MRFPPGADGGTITNPQADGLIEYLMAFCGAIEIETGAGHGFILTKNGNLKAAYFKTGDITFRGKESLKYLTMDSSKNGPDQVFNLRRYSKDEYDNALKIAEEEHLLLSSLSQKTETRMNTPPLFRHFWMRQNSGKLSVSPVLLQFQRFLRGSPFSLLVMQILNMSQHWQKI
ncbi:MAG: hypothetical protein WCH85_08450 [Methanomicrobiales archaeon]